MKILLAEDNPEVRSLVAEVLRDQGHEVHAYGEGRQALEAAKSLHPQLLVTDFDMPGLDGVELCRRLRQQQASLPAVLISSRCGESDWTPSEAMVCLAKPFRRQQLLDAVDAALLGPQSDSSRTAFGPETPQRSRRRPRPSSRWSSPSWRWGVAAAVLVMVGLPLYSNLETIWGPPALPEPVRQGVQRAATLQVEAPRGVLAKLPEAAVWQAVPQASVYHLRFETVDGNVLFESRTPTSPWPLPEALRQQLPTNVAFHWQVEAMSSSGHLLARSSRTRFRVVAPLDDAPRSDVPVSDTTARTP